MVDVKNLVSQSVEYYYEPNAENDIECHVHALGIVFTDMIPSQDDKSPEFWSTQEGLFARSMEFGVN